MQNLDYDLVSFLQGEKEMLLNQLKDKEDKYEKLYAIAVALEIENEKLKRQENVPIEEIVENKSDIDMHKATIQEQTIEELKKRLADKEHDELAQQVQCSLYKKAIDNLRHRISSQKGMLKAQGKEICQLRIENKRLQKEND